MEVLALFLVIFLGFSLLFRLPVAFGIGLGGAVVFAVFGYSMNSFSQTAFYGIYHTFQCCLFIFSLTDDLYLIPAFHAGAKYAQHALGISGSSIIVKSYL